MNRLLTAVLFSIQCLSTSVCGLKKAGDGFGFKAPAGSGLWNTLGPDGQTTTLLWLECPQVKGLSSRQQPLCAYIVRRLNPDNPEDHRTVTLHLTRYSSPHIDETHPEFKGFIFHIFGGPGENAVQKLWQNGPAYERLTKYHTHVAFNLRGTFETGPDLTCFEDRWDERSYHKMTLFRNGPSMVSSGIVGAEKQRLSAEDLSTRCSAGESPENSRLKYVGAAHAGEDILFLHDLLTRHYFPDSRPASGNQAKVSIWASSWGSHVADYLLQIHQIRMNSVIIESPLDLVSTQNHKAAFLSKLTEVDHVISSLCHYCAKGSDCPLATQKNKELTTVEVCARIQDLWNLFKQRAAVSTVDKLDTQLVELNTFFYSCLYDLQVKIYSCFETLQKFEELFSDHFKNSNEPYTKPLFDRTVRDWFAADNIFRIRGGQLPLKAEPYLETHLITCVDVAGMGIEGSGSGVLYGVWEEAARLSVVGADAQFPRFAACLYLRGQSQKRIPEKRRAITTSTPVLFLGNRYDHVSPSRYVDGTFKHLKHYQNSYYVELLTSGHGVMPNIRCLCLNKAISNYLQYGDLPAEKYTSCSQQIQYPFGATEPYEPAAESEPLFKLDTTQPVIGRSNIEPLPRQKRNIESEEDFYLNREV
ncbi:hypothetical protein BJ508DRAFT_367486 [Ascobolus immersus RN42]|uniref:Peptidase S33 tripeptidyl aminopeptidase-like C-terminal domain-containing protein n=1 Tax=Ascobolus immersus RN42 TaxID=1160509 RepID=A0A3N4HCD1_ASCIM|nr:hypothetical protein BJ508DRAFT_367486 [Ascobolus immersus RN42]